MAARFSLGSRQVTLTHGELEPAFVSYATLRRHTFCFKGMKQCEFDHDPTDSRAPLPPRPAHRIVAHATFVRSLARPIGPSFSHRDDRISWLMHASGYAHSVAFVISWVHWELTCTLQSHYNRVLLPGSRVC